MKRSELSSVELLDISTLQILILVFKIDQVINSFEVINDQKNNIPSYEMQEMFDL